MCCSNDLKPTTLPNFVIQKHSRGTSRGGSQKGEVVSHYICLWIRSFLWIAVFARDALRLNRQCEAPGQCFSISCRCRQTPRIDFESAGSATWRGRVRLLRPLAHQRRLGWFAAGSRSVQIFHVVRKFFPLSRLRHRENMVERSSLRRCSGHLGACEGGCQSAAPRKLLRFRGRLRHTASSGRSPSLLGWTSGGILEVFYLAQKIAACVWGKSGEGGKERFLSALPHIAWRQCVRKNERQNNAPCFTVAVRLVVQPRKLSLFILSKLRWSGFGLLPASLFHRRTVFQGVVVETVLHYHKHRFSNIGHLQETISTRTCVVPISLSVWKWFVNQKEKKKQTLIRIVSLVSNARSCCRFYCEQYSHRYRKHYFIQRFSEVLSHWFPNLG